MRKIALFSVVLCAAFLLFSSEMRCFCQTEKSAHNVEVYGREDGEAETLPADTQEGFSTVASEDEKVKEAESVLDNEVGLEDKMMERAEENRM